MLRVACLLYVISTKFSCGTRYAVDVDLVLLIALVFFLLAKLGEPHAKGLPSLEDLNEEKRG